MDAKNGYWAWKASVAQGFSDLVTACNATQHLLLEEDMDLVGYGFVCSSAKARKGAGPQEFVIKKQELELQQDKVKASWNQCRSILRLGPVVWIWRAGSCFSGARVGAEVLDFCALKGQKDGPLVEKVEDRLPVDMADERWLSGRVARERTVGFPSNRSINRGVGWGGVKTRHFPHTVSNALLQVEFRV